MEQKYLQVNVSGILLAYEHTHTHTQSHTLTGVVKINDDGGRLHSRQVMSVGTTMRIYLPIRMTSYIFFSRFIIA